MKRILFIIFITLLIGATAWLFLVDGEEAVHQRIMHYFGCQDAEIHLNLQEAFTICKDKGHVMSVAELDLHTLNDMTFWTLRYATVLTLLLFLVAQLRLELIHEDAAAEPEPFASH